MHRFEIDYAKRKKRRILIWTLVSLLVILVLVALSYYFLSEYKVEDVYVDGNVHYTDDEVKERILAGPLGENSLYLSLKYKNKEIKDVPFVDSIQVQIIDKHKIRISVYEKAVAGFVEYLGKYMYFDKDGTVVESSSVKTSGIVEITGLSFDYMVLGKSLPVSDETIFKRILNMNQLLTKYGLKCERLDFDPSGEETLYFGKVRVLLGKDNDEEKKIMVLPQILPEVEGRSGVIDMKDYEDSSDAISFSPDS